MSFTKYAEEVWFRGLLLFLSFILLILIFSPNPVRVKEKLKLYKTSAQTQPSTGNFENPPFKDIEKLLTIEHEKANTEIKMLQEQIDTWYHYKFILIGGMIALFLGHFSLFGKQDGTSPKKSEKVLIVTLMSNRTAILLALACVVALVID